MVGRVLFGQALQDLALLVRTGVGTAPARQGRAGKRKQDVLDEGHRRRRALDIEEHHAHIAASVMIDHMPPTDGGMYAGPKQSGWKF